MIGIGLRSTHRIRTVSGGQDRLSDMVPAIFLGLLVVLAVVLMPVFQTDGLDRVAVLFPNDLPRETVFAAIVAGGGVPVDTVPGPLPGLDVWLVKPEGASLGPVADALALLNPYALGGCLDTGV